MGALISIPPLFVDQPCRRRILQSNPQEDLVSNPVKCDFTLSSLLEDTAGHSLSLPCIQWEVPREFFLHRSELIPPPVLGFERFEENKYTSIKRRRMIVQCKEEDVEKNGYRQTDRLTDRNAIH